MERPLRAVRDASVLYPVSLRHLFMRLALEGVFQPKWSAAIHEEWIRSVLKDNPDIPPLRLYALRDAMDDRIDDAVVTGYEHRIAALSLPDPNDRHVLAAAIVGGADVIVTCNLKGFPHQSAGPIQDQGDAPGRVHPASHDRIHGRSSPRGSRPAGKPDKATNPHA